MGRKVFLDVGGHEGESLRAALADRWGFDRLWTFEPTSTCLPALRALADERVVIVPAGLWKSDTSMDIHDPGALHASVDEAASRGQEVERCEFIDAARWMAENIDPSDIVWMKVNIESAEVEVLSRLIDSGEIRKVDHLVVHFDVEKVGRADAAIPVRSGLDDSGVEWFEARDVLFGRTDSAKVETWLARTHGYRWAFLRRRYEHRLRARIWETRRSLAARSRRAGHQ